MTSVAARLLTFGRMIKFSHSIFAMPFALASFALATRREGFAPQTLLWVIVAMVAARSAAMGFNRWLDADIDARNEAGETALMRTVSMPRPGFRSEHLAVVRILIAAGADVSLRDAAGRTAREIAVNGGHSGAARRIEMAERNGK